MTTSIGFDIYARDTASAKFDALGNRIDNTSSKFTKIGQAAKVAGLAMVAGIGMGAVALVGMTKGAIEDEAAQQKLALGLKNATNATDAQVVSAEKWITAQGNALGVTDDELRPALQKLAQSTGDVGQAQKQLQIAMDISAGSGKSLASVTEAMMKANNGSVSGLGRLGVATKNAAGETMSMDAIMKRAANTFSGQAAAKADTLGGKMAILKLRFDEAKETIGAKLIPVLTDLSDWVLATGVPAIERFVQQWKDGTGAGGNFAATLTTIKDATVGTVAFLLEHKTAVAGLVVAYGAFQVAQIAMSVASAASLLILKAQTVGTATHAAVSAASTAGILAWAAAQWVLNAAMTANPIGIVVVAVGALIGIFLLAMKHSDGFRTTVTAAFGKVKDAASATFGWVKQNWPLLLAIITGPIGLAVLAVVKNWDTIRDKTSAAWDAVRSLVTDKLGAVRDAAQNVGAAVRDRLVGAWDAVKIRTSEIWSAMVDLVGDKISNVVDKAGEIKDRILGKFVGASAWLYNAGSELVQGLINGITAKIGALTAKMSELASKIKGYLPGSPVKTGPLTSWNNGGAGKRLVGLLADGMSDTAPVDAAMRNLASRANIVGSGSMAIGASGTGLSVSSGGSSGGGDTFIIHMHGVNDPEAFVAGLRQYVRRNGPLRGIAAT